MRVNPIRPIGAIRREEAKTPRERALEHFRKNGFSRPSAKQVSEWIMQKRKEGAFK